MDLLLTGFSLSVFVALAADLTSSSLSGSSVHAGGSSDLNLDDFLLRESLIRHANMKSSAYFVKLKETYIGQC